MKQSLLHMVHDRQAKPFLCHIHQNHSFPISLLPPLTTSNPRAPVHQSSVVRVINLGAFRRPPVAIALQSKERDFRATVARWGDQPEDTSLRGLEMGGVQHEVTIAVREVTRLRYNTTRCLFLIFWA